MNTLVISQSITRTIRQYAIISTEYEYMET